jgi:hypothetical protein
VGGYRRETVFRSPSKRQEAEARYEVLQRLKMEEQLTKAQKKQLRANNKLLKENLEEEKRVAREAAKVVREKEKAEQAAGKSVSATSLRRRQSYSTVPKG